jgi:hypothetical protein
MDGGDGLVITETNAMTGVMSKEVAHSEFIQRLPRGCIWLGRGDTRFHSLEGCLVSRALGFGKAPLLIVKSTGDHCPSEVRPVPVSHYGELDQNQVAFFYNPIGGRWKIPRRAGPQPANHLSFSSGVSNAFVAYSLRENCGLDGGSDFGFALARDSFTEKGRQPEIGNLVGQANPRDLAIRLFPAQLHQLRTEIYPLSTAARTCPGPENRVDSSPRLKEPLGGCNVPERAFVANALSEETALGKDLAKELGETCLWIIITDPPGAEGTHIRDPAPFSLSTFGDRCKQDWLPLRWKNYN